MATLYVDLISGNDGAGDGSAGAPYLTVNKAVSIAGGPHDIRVAKTTAYTSVACGGAGVGWTANSVTVTTGADLRASIAVGDYIGKTTAAGNGAEETFYRVNGITATTITLEIKYGGATASEASCNKLVIITTGTAGADAMTLATSTVLSGGWNLTGTPAQDGETWFKSNNARTVLKTPIVSASSASISKMNIAESYCGIANANANGGVGSGTTTTNCTVIVLVFAHGNNTSVTVDTCCLSSVQNTTITVGSTTTCTNTIILCGGATTNYPVSLTAGCVFNYNKVISSIANGCLLPISNQEISYCEFRNCVAGVWQSSNIVNFTIKNCTFNNCSTVGIAPYNSSGWVIKNCTFTSCSTNGINVQAFHGAVIDSCSFTSCGRGITTGADSGDVYLTNCSFITPTTYGIDKTLKGGTVFCTACTIDGASLAKAYAVPADGYALKQYVFQNSFGVTGTVWGVGSVKQDSTTFRTTAPSTSISWVGTTTLNNLDVKIVSAYVNASATRTYSMYIQAANASWAGTLTPKWKLNGVLIKTESNITSLTTSWVQYSWTCDTSLITTDGELSLEFTPNMNNYAIYVDDFQVA